MVENSKKTEVNSEEVYSVVDPKAQGDISNKIRPINLSLMQKSETMNNKSIDDLTLSIYWGDVWEELVSLSFDESIRAVYEDLKKQLEAIQNLVELKDYEQAEIDTNIFLENVKALQSKFTAKACRMQEFVNDTVKDLFKVAYDETSKKVLVRADNVYYNYILSKFDKVDGKLITANKASDSFMSGYARNNADLVELFYYAADFGAEDKRAIVSVMKNRQPLGFYRMSMKDYSSVCRLISFDLNALGYVYDRIQGWVKQSESYNTEKQSAVTMQNIFFDTVDEAKKWQEAINKQKKEEVKDQEVPVEALPEDEAVEDQAVVEEAVEEVTEKPKVSPKDEAIPSRVEEDMKNLNDITDFQNNMKNVHLSKDEKNISKKASVARDEVSKKQLEVLRKLNLPKDILTAFLVGDGSAKLRTEIETGIEKNLTEDDLMTNVKKLFADINDSNSILIEAKVNDSRVEVVQIGLDNAGKYETHDTERLLEDGDTVYRIMVDTAIDEEPVYFDSEEAVKNYLKEISASKKEAAVKVKVELKKASYDVTVSSSNGAEMVVAKDILEKYFVDVKEYPKNFVTVRVWVDDITDSPADAKKFVEDILKENKIEVRAKVVSVIEKKAEPPTVTKYHEYRDAYGKRLSEGDTVNIAGRNEKYKIKSLLADGSVLLDNDGTIYPEELKLVVSKKARDKKYECPHCGFDVTNDEGSTCPNCGKIYWDDEKEIYPKQVDAKKADKFASKKVSRNWLYKINLNFLHDYDDADEDNLPKELIDKTIAAIDEILEKVTDVNVKTQLREIKFNFKDVTTQEDFNNILEDLYDLGDSESIWINTFASKKAARIETLDDARDRLSELIDEAEGPYTHNMVSLLLRQVAEKFGYDKANALIKEYDLTDLFGIRPVEKKAAKDSKCPHCPTGKMIKSDYIKAHYKWLVCNVCGYMMETLDEDKEVAESNVGGRREEYAGDEKQVERNYKKQDKILEDAKVETKQLKDKKASSDKKAFDTDEVKEELDNFILEDFEDGMSIKETVNHIYDFFSGRPEGEYIENFIGNEFDLRHYVEQVIDSNKIESSDKEAAKVDSFPPDYYEVRVFPDNSEELKKMFDTLVEAFDDQYVTYSPSKTIILVKVYDVDSNKAAEDHVKEVLREKGFDVKANILLSKRFN